MFDSVGSQIGSQDRRHRRLPRLAAQDNSRSAVLPFPRLCIIHARSCDRVDPSGRPYADLVDELDAERDATDDPAEQARLYIAAGHLHRDWTDRCAAYADRFTTLHPLTRRQSKEARANADRS